MSKNTFKTLVTRAAHISEDLIIDNPAPGHYNVEVKSRDKKGCIDANLFHGTLSECLAFLDGMKAMQNNWYKIRPFEYKDKE